MSINGVRGIGSVSDQSEHKQEQFSDDSSNREHEEFIFDFLLNHLGMHEEMALHALKLITSSCDDLAALVKGIKEGDEFTLFSLIPSYFK